MFIVVNCISWAATEMSGLKMSKLKRENTNVT